MMKRVWDRTLPTFIRETRTTRRRALLPTAPPGNGQPVLLVPGLLAPNSTLARLGRWLDAAGWAPHTADVGWNVGCSRRMVDIIEARAEQISAATGQRLVLIGQSRGGLHARVLASQRPELVAHVLTLGSPVRDALAVRPSTAKQLSVLTALGNVGLRRVLTSDCLDGDCGGAYQAALTATLPDHIRLTSIWSPTDGVVIPAACRDPHATCLEIRSTHQGMGMNASIWKLIAQELAPSSVARGWPPGRQS